MLQKVGAQITSPKQNENGVTTPMLSQHLDSRLKKNDPHKSSNRNMQPITVSEVDDEELYQRALLDTDARLTQEELEEREREQYVKMRKE